MAGLTKPFVILITAGIRVDAVDASGRRLRRRAVSGVVPGHDFQVVWICREEEWQLAQSEGREPDAVPWPAEDVQVAEGDEDDANEAAFRVVTDATEDE